MSKATTTVRVISNGDYAVLVTASGGGYSALRGLALTRWQPDPSADDDGQRIYIRDVDSGEYWSLSDGTCSVTVYDDHLEQTCEHDGILVTCVIRVDRDRNAETRTIRVTNQSGRERTIDVTTYAELSLNTAAADAAHPAFAKLFVQTAFDAGRNVLIAWRRLRSPDDRALWVGQRLTGAVEYETDRTRFIGRTRTASNPAALNSRAPLSGNTGTVLDPVFGLRAPLQIAADESAEIVLLQCAADTRAELERMLDAPCPAVHATGSDPGALGIPPKWLPGIAFDLYEYAWEGSGAQHRTDETPARSDYGRFSNDGSEYIMDVAAHLQPAPQPWINVIANEQFGFLISETGAGYTWAANSRENRLTAWRNDPVSDPHGETLLVRDEERGTVWSMLPGPLPADAPYTVHHGFGYSRFEHSSNGLDQDVLLYVPRHDPVKITRVRITNTGAQTRRLSLTSSAELVLGGTPAETRASVHTGIYHDVVFATNADREEYADRVAFAFGVGAPAPQVSVSGSRISVQLAIEIEPGATFDCAFLLGEAADAVQAHECTRRYRSLAAIDDAHEVITAFWRDLLTRVTVQTPVPALDVMLNGWLAYQNLACRMWARSAFYQSGGAFGFRDQLQDSSALVYLDPRITRDQILLHAAHQFVEGDVLHWWHPPASKGIRTHFSDDLLWLPYITAFYLARTGDAAILDESVRFITAKAVPDGEDEVFLTPTDSGEKGTLYEHCCRSIDRSLTKGAHGLPLMGSGDWNDGMNRVGREGHGESVWLGFFLYEILDDFIPVCEARGDAKRVAAYTAYQEDLHAALNRGGWDGAWYRRAYYDDGTPLGSAHNDECRIDALAQAWSVISGVASRDRAEQAMAAMQQQLVSEEDGLIRLLTPAFDKTPHDPGYIKGYVPGVRENGGQYTHAAMWAVRALAEMGLRERAAPLLEMLSPVTRANDPQTYQGEPYVVAADVYGEAPHVGRAGWTWYTGSAGWMYRVFLESLLGLDLRGDVVHLRPCLPAAWPGYTLRYRFDDGTVYTFEVTQTAEPRGPITIPIVRNGLEHYVRVEAGPDAVPRYSPSTAPLLRTTLE
jgi:N,N'-diacetylchitobiose phosphorylase